VGRFRRLAVPAAAAGVLLVLVATVGATLHLDFA